jgi:hypothetical protein
MDLENDDQEIETLAKDDKASEKLSPATIRNIVLPVLRFQILSKYL